MTLLIAITVLALIFGFFLPLRWGYIGYVAATILLFLAQALINTATGFEGIPISESLLLFNDSYLSYVGFNLQITYRAFTLPLLALATSFIFRLARSRT